MSERLSILNKNDRKQKLEAVADDLYRRRISTTVSKSEALDHLLDEYIGRNNVDYKNKTNHEYSK